MDRFKLFRPKDVLLFEEDKNRGCTGSFLKTFLQFLSFSKVQRPIKFSYVAESSELVSNLTIKENILLDSIPNSLNSTKEFQFQQFLKNCENPHIAPLLTCIEDVNKFPKMLNKASIKLAAIVKALLQNGPYLLMERPESFLDTEAIQLLCKALKYQLSTKDLTILMTSRDFSIWDGLATKVIQRDSLKRFIVRPILDPYAKGGISTTFKESA